MVLPRPGLPSVLAGRAFRRYKVFLVTAMREFRQRHLMGRWRLRIGVVALVLLAAACGTTEPDADAPAIEATNIDPAAPGSVYDPLEAKVVPPDGYRESLARDRIAPVYNPKFVNANKVNWPGESLVIGVEIDGDARAYPVGFLTQHEIVNDLHKGIPTLVTW